MTSSKKNQTPKRRRPSTVLPSTSTSSRKRNTGPQVNITNEIQDDTTKRVYRSIPAFLSKLYSMVDDDSIDLIHWSEDGTSFIVQDQESFSKTVLPKYFKHNTFSSFVRQLNMYDFHKIPHVRHGVLVNDGEQEHWEFEHPHFCRGKQDTLHLVVRKKIRPSGSGLESSTTPPLSSSIPSDMTTASLSPDVTAAVAAAAAAFSPQSILPLAQLSESELSSLPIGVAASSSAAAAAAAVAAATINPNIVSELDRSVMDNDVYQGRLDQIRLGSLVKDISSIRQHQHAITTDLQHLHNDNEVLWREILLAREKHQRHQQVIERILLFLTTVFSNDNQLDMIKNPRFMLGEHNEFITTSSLGN